jgi:hypothetical protein
MCMSCNTKGLSKNKKIILFSSLGSGIAAASYMTFTTTSNPAIAATIPALLSVAACPVMCIAMGGVMWFMNRLSKNKNKDNHMVMTSHGVEEQEKGEKSTCRGFQQADKNIQDTEYKLNDSNDDEDVIQTPPPRRLQKHELK